MRSQFRFASSRASPGRALRTVSNAYNAPRDQAGQGGFAVVSFEKENTMVLGKAFAALAVAFALFVQSAPAGEKPLEIGAILLDVRHEWFVEVIEGMKAAEKELGAKVTILSSDSDVAKESDIVDNLIAQQYDAITISPQNDEASIPAFERALAAGIPVVPWNSKVASEESKYFVGVDNYSLGADTGRYAAKFINDRMGGKAKVAIIGNTLYSVGRDRVRGFMDEMAKLPGVEIVANQDAEFKETGMSVTENVLEAHPDTQIVWCWNQGALLGALAALNGKGDTDVVLMGTDMSIDLARAMLEPDAFLHAVTTQQPFDLGFQAVKAAADLAREREIPAEILVPLKTYTLDDKADVQKYLDDRKYLQ